MSTTTDVGDHYMYDQNSDQHNPHRWPLTNIDQQHPKSYENENKHPRLEICAKVKHLIWTNWLLADIRDELRHFAIEHAVGTFGQCH